jgi:hypothetical protein
MAVVVWGIEEWRFDSATIIVAAFGWALVNALSRSWLFTSKRGWQLSFREQQVAEHSVSLLHAVGSSVAALFVASDPKMQQDLIFSRCDWFRRVYPLTVGYMLYDSVLICLALGPYHTQLTRAERSLQWQYVGHHAFIIASGVYKTVMQPRAGDFAISVFLLQELTNVPHNLRLLSLTAGQSDRKWLSLDAASPWHLIVGVWFLLSYLVCRFGCVIWFLILYSQQTNVPLHLLHRTIPLKCSIGTALVVSLNLYWLRFIVAKVAARFHEMRSASEGQTRPRKSRTVEAD